MERICILAFLGINSWKDIRTREVSLLSIVVFGIVGMIRACFLGTVSVDLVWKALLGWEMVFYFCRLEQYCLLRNFCQHFYWDFFAAVFGGLWCYFCQEKGKRLRCLSFHFLCWDTLEV